MATSSTDLPYRQSMDQAISFFYELAGENEEISSKLAAADRTPAAWVRIAQSAGFDFNEYDLQAVVEELIQRPITPDTVVQELVQDVATVSATGIQFSDKALDRLRAVMQQGRFSGYYRPW
jgi:predicted ribosomally synthesized peptide with nif11-like leader